MFHRGNVTIFPYERAYTTRQYSQISTARTLDCKKKLDSELPMTCGASKMSQFHCAEVLEGDVIPTNNCMHENQPQLNDSWLQVEPVSEDDILSHWALTRSYSTAHTRTNTSSDVQTHIPLVGSWSKVRKFEICQPIGDWVIEEFDSERNILLPWWCTRRNVHVEQEAGLVGKTEIDH